MGKLKLLLKIIFFSKKILKRPKNVEILMYDDIHQSIFKSFFKNNSFDAFDIRFNEINIIILLKIIIFKGIKNILYNYSLEYIKIVNPKIVINFLDTRIDFYKLKKNFKNMKFVSIQFAYRANKYPDIFQTLKLIKEKNLTCDYIFCFSNSVGKEYLKYIDTKIISLGSFRNNIYLPNFKKKGLEIKKRISFISQFRRPIKDSERSLHKINMIDRNEFYLPEKVCLPIVQNLSFRHNFEFSIIGCSKNEDDLELNFFKKILNNNNFKFFKPKNDYDSYKECYESEIIVFIDSTLGYEAISAGKKAISINSRKPFYDVVSGFGWPFENELKGEFWTNDHSSSEIERIFNYIVNVPSEEWNINVNEFKKNILNFNENNSLLLEKLEL